MESSNASPISTKPHPKALVCLYAQRDEPLYRDLQKYLVLWQKQDRIYWADPAAVHQADLILLLLSPSFFATTACHTAMVRAIELRTERGIPVVPLLARASDWKESDCGGLQALPDNERPIAEWEQPERAYENICAGLARVLPDLPALGIAQPEGLHLFQAPKLPDGYVARPKEFAAAKQLLLHRQSTQAAAIPTALRGAGGFGKTTLAKALCHDSEVQAAFSDGILWVELGEQRRKPLDVLNSILAALEPSRTEAVTLEEAKQRWQAALHGRVCLLVIDDVWRLETLLPLLDGGPSCRRLVTTRNDLLLPRDAARVLVDAMEPQEAVAVLCMGLLEAIHRTAYQSNLEALAARLGCWPLLLILANGLLTDLVDAQMGIAEALATVAQAYQTRGVTAFRLDNVEERQRTVEACLEVSLLHLETFTPPHYRAPERYQELAVFPEDTDIPLETLQIYWKRTGRLELWETKDLCIRLHRLSLLLTCDLGVCTIRLHDVVRSYLIQRSRSHLPALHGRLLDACQQHSHLTRWADLPQSEAYLWHRLVYHLCQAGDLEALQTTLTDLLFVTRKVVALGVSALEADLALAMESLLQEGEEHALPPLAPLLQVIRRSSHLLRQVASEAEIVGLLVSHLHDNVDWAHQRQALEQDLPRPCFTGWHPLPTPFSLALIRTLRGHTDSVNACAFSPDGTRIVSASEDETLKVWDSSIGALLLTLRGHTWEINACAFSPDGTRIVSASVDETLKVWDSSTGAELLTLSGHTDSVTACAFSPDGKRIISASTDSTLKVWEATTGAQLLTLTGHSTGVTSCGFSSDGTKIVSASWDKTLKVWNSTTGAELLTLVGHTSEVSCCAVSPDSKLIVSASLDKTLKVWDAATGAEYFTLIGHADRVNACTFGPDGTRIVSASSDYTLKVWNSSTGAELLTLRGHPHSVRACAFSPNGTSIVSASSDYTLKVWDSSMGAELLTLRGHPSSIRACAFSPDGEFIVSASSDYTLKVWNSSTGAEWLTLRGHTDSINACAFSPDGTRIVSASEDETLKVWDSTTGEELLTLSGHTISVNTCWFSPDGKQIVSADDWSTLKVWNSSTGAELRTLSAHIGCINACWFSPDGTRIVFASYGGELTLWNAFARAKGRTLRRRTGLVSTWRLSPDGTKVRIAAASYGGALKLWNDFTRAKGRTLEGHTDYVEACGYSPNSTRIVSASLDRTLKVWDSTTGEELLTLSGHTDSVNACAFSSDGRWIVSASSDQTLKVWETQRGVCVLTYPVDEALWGCAFHPDGEHLVACGDAGMYFLRLIQ